MQAEASSLLLYDPLDGKLHFHVATGDKGELIKKFSMNMGEGIGGWVAQHREALMIDDCYEDPRFNPEYDKKSRFKTRSMVCVDSFPHAGSCSPSSIAGGSRRPGSLSRHPSITSRSWPHG